MNRDLLISTPAKRYARAMLEVAVQQRNFSVVLQELELFTKQLREVPLLQKLFLNPAIPHEKKISVLEQLSARLKFQTVTVNFLNTLIQRDRLNLLDQMIVSAEQQFLEQQGILVVEVITAKRLLPDEETKLTARLEVFTGKKVQLENKLDPSMIGGVVTRIGTTLYDGSVQAQLQQLKARIQEA